MLVKLLLFRCKAFTLALVCAVVIVINCVMWSLLWALEPSLYHLCWSQGSYLASVLAVRSAVEEWKQWSKA